MKKIIYFFFAAVLITGTLIAPVAALDSEDFYISCSPYLQVHNVNTDITPITINLNGVVESRNGCALDYLHMPISSGGNTAQTLIVTTFRVEANNVSSIIPTDILVDNEIVGSLTYNASTGRYMGNVSTFANMYVTLQSVDTDTVTINCFLNFRSGIPRLISLGFDYSGVDFSHNYIKYFGYPSTCIALSGATNQDIVDSNDAIVDAIEAMASSSGTSSNAIVEALHQTGATITTNANTNATQISASVEQVKSAVDIMEQNMSGNVADGLKQYDEAEEEKLVGELDDNVGSIRDSIDDLLGTTSVSATRTFSLVKDAFTDSSTDCNFTIPAGTVNLLGSTYTFWDSQTVDLNSFFQLDGIQALLIGFRFLVGYGALCYSIEWINKIISLVLMEDVGLSAQEWRSEYRSGVRANNYRKK